MAVASVLARLRREPLADCPPLDHVDQLRADCAHNWRDRVLTPAVTLRLLLLLLQVLHGNTAIAHLRQLSGLAFAPASYCEARQRLPLSDLLGLLETLAQWADGRVHPAADGPRVLVFDGSSFTTADTPGLRDHFGL